MNILEERNHIREQKKKLANQLIDILNPEIKHQLAARFKHVETYTQKRWLRPDKKITYKSTSFLIIRRNGTIDIKEYADGYSRQKISGRDLSNPIVFSYWAKQALQKYIDNKKKELSYEKSKKRVLEDLIKSLEENNEL